MLATAEADIQMSTDEFLMIRDFIHERSGIYFAENKAYLVRNRLAKRMADLDIRSVRDYFYHVKYDASQAEFNRLMELVTTNETSFFRNEPQLLSFSEEVLPLILKEKMASSGSKTLRVWSAGCSTGEEPYTLAMLILDRLITLNGWQIEIIANDISEETLRRARSAEYSGPTLRNVKPEILTRYFTKNGDVYQVKPEVRSLVKFSYMNLNDPRRTSAVLNMDVIFCRNVMIYFSDEAKKELVRRYYNALRPGGYFYIGHSETLHGVSKAFRLVYFKNALVYQKEVVGTGTGSSPIVSAGIEIASSSGREPAGTDGKNRAVELLKHIKPVGVGAKTGRNAG